MSRIYFHSPSGTEEIYGRERAWMRGVTDDVATGLIATRHCVDLAKFLPAGAYPLAELKDQFGSAPRFADRLSLWLGGHDARFVVDGEDYDCFTLMLNTCLAIGNGPLRLCARLHGQCEIHAYCEGADRDWLAGIVVQGIRCGLMRDGGSERERGQWTRLADWLRSRSDEPVVTSYSVCDQFPSAGVAKGAGLWSPGPDHQGTNPDGRPWWDGDEWYEIPSEERWRICLEAIRSQEEGLRLHPDGWEDFRFGHEKDAFWLWEQARRSRE